MDFPKSDLVLDLRGLTCPAPILQTKKAIDQLQSGQIMEIWGTDPGTNSDMPAWTKRVGHEFLGSKEKYDFVKYYVKKK